MCCSGNIQYVSNCSSLLARPTCATATRFTSARSPPNKSRFRQYILLIITTKRNICVLAQVLHPGDVLFIPLHWYAPDQYYYLAKTSLHLLGGTTCAASRSVAPNLRIHSHPACSDHNGAFMSRFLFPSPSGSRLGPNSSILL